MRSRGSQAEGKKILDSLTGKNAHEYTFRKKDQGVTLACKTAVRLNDDDVQVDPQLMFSRLSIVATTGGFESPEQCFECEMCSFPASLFDASLLPLKANKPVLADAIWPMTKESQTANDPGGSAYFVIDGGALLHRAVWPRGLTYNAICFLYIQCEQRRYPRATTTAMTMVPPLKNVNTSEEDMDVDQLFCSILTCLLL